MHRWFAIALVTLLTATSSSARAGDLSEREIRDARKLYVAKCARCHKLYHPAKYSDAAWREWMNKMSRKARLKPDQRELLSRYLEAMRSHGQTNAPVTPRR